MTTDATWYGAPWPALMVPARAEAGTGVLANPAAGAWALRHGLSLAALEQAATAAASLPVGANNAPVALGAGPWQLHVTPVTLPDGRTLVWLQLADGGSRLDRPFDRRATDFLDQALALADVVVWRMDIARQRIHYNAVGFKAMGMEQHPDGISLDHLHAITHPQDRPRVARANQQALDGDEVVDLVARYRFPDGSWRHQLTRRVALRDGQGQVIGLSGIAIDVTELHREREQVQRLHELAALAAQALGVGFWSSQVDRNGQLTLVGDEQLHRIYGCAPGQTARDHAQWLREFVHPDDRDWVAQRIARAEAECTPLLDIRCRIVTRQGRQRWVHSWTHRTELQGQSAVYGMEVDVTDSQHELQERQRAQQREQFAIEAAGVGIWERDAQGHVLYWNENMYRQRGCTSQDPRHPDQIMRDTTAPEDRAVLVAAYPGHIANGEPYRKELRLLLPDGSQRWIISQGRPVRDAQGQVVGMAGINLDVTERKHAAMLEAEVQRAEQASREKSAFMARMSHELRTPMNAVLGFSQLMRDDPNHALTGPQLQRLSLIENAGHALLKLINDLLDIARRSDRPPAEPAAPPTPPVSTAVQLLQHMAAAPGAALAAAPEPVQRLRVLCVEDNPVNLLLVREVLAMRPHVQLRCAEDGRTGVAMAQQEAPDLVLLDLQLPDISGHEVFRQLRQQPALAQCRFVALSADAMPDSIDAALAEGFDDYWTKPIQFDRFLSNIDKLVLQRGGGPTAPA